MASSNAINVLRTFGVSPDALPPAPTRAPGRRIIDEFAGRRPATPTRSPDDGVSPAHSPEPGYAIDGYLQGGQVEHCANPHGPDQLLHRPPAFSGGKEGHHLVAGLL